MTEDRCDLLCLDLPHAEAVRGGLPNVEQAAGPAQQFRALADPQRLRIAAALQAGGELCVCDLAWIVGASQNLVSHHARVLRTAGMAASRKDGKLVMYRLTDIGQALLAMAGIVPPAAVPDAGRPVVSAAPGV
ncbi:metalloregulator ArsR/SmtB family transcription factor [Modestobacter sp. Leaf380]|uniref:ArsR/SmtB family transcription factor n=1 Tax=Modestobacter sp. Leaf380 TaxID=1736356 RepID=UPI0006FCE14B|nr:metalloregulator ArsR/SmtB family transcription factor [Modestobacter sp. Leaf380]KQS64308.1 ArsR family transcriptional regulator [Modestobacter sp. Leaf380]